MVPPIAGARAPCAPGNLARLVKESLESNWRKPYSEDPDEVARDRARVLDDWPLGIFDAGGARSPRREQPPQRIWRTPWRSAWP